MSPRKLLGLDGVLERCPACGKVLKAGAWLKDGEAGKPRVLMILSYCRQCKKHIRSTYLFYEQYAFSMSNKGQPEAEATVYQADPLQVSPERVAV